MIYIGTKWNLKRWHRPHLGRLLARLTVQAAYPPALQRLVVERVRLHLLPLEGGAVAGLQVGLLQRRLVLGGSFDWLNRLHVFVCLELGSGGANWEGVRGGMLFFLFSNELCMLLF